MALFCARPVSESGSAISSPSVQSCRRSQSTSRIQVVVTKLAPAANLTVSITNATARSRRSYYCDSSLLSQFSHRPWLRMRGTSPLRRVLATAFASTEAGGANRGREECILPPLKVAIIGFGNFGQFIAKGIKRQGHEVVVTSRTDYSSYCVANGIRFHRSMDAMCSNEQPLDVLLVCSSILSTEPLVRRIPFHLLSPDTVVADVLSVKQFPKNLFLDVLPPEMGILCTHPMFGPESGKHGWGGLPFVYDKVRLADSKSRQARNCKRFLQIFEAEGCRMVEMSCEEHDRYAAESQFITHTIGRILSHLNLESTPINTKGYETLLQLTENTLSDSFDLYYGLFMYNVNATEQMDNLDRAFEAVKQKLFGRLHDVLRKQLVERVPITSSDVTTTITTTAAPRAASTSAKAAAGATPLTSPLFLPRKDDITSLSSFAISREAAAAASSTTTIPVTDNK